MPFRTGGIELAFKAIARLAKQGATADLYFVPVSIKYIYTGQTDKKIAKSLKELETALSIQPAEANFYSRLRSISLRVLSNLETEYNITPPIESDPNQRITALKKHFLQYCEDRLNLKTASQLPNRERVYKIQSVLADLSQANPNQDNYQHLKLTTVRLLNFDAIYDGYVAQKPTTERFFATLDRLEREVFQIDRPKSKGMRKVRVKINTPINAAEYWSNNKGGDEQTIQDLTQAIEQQVQVNLN